MAEKRDYYEVLGVSRSASADEIKSAYKQITLKWHPYKWVNGTEEEKKKAEAIFKEASEAYSVLSDPEKKKRYDQFGHAGIDGQGAADFSNFDLNDILSNLFGGSFSGFSGFSGFGGFGGFGGQGGQARDRVVRGRDIRTRVKLTLEEIAKGVTKTVAIERNEACPECGGKGTKNASDIETCPNCKGTGQEQHMSAGIFGRTITYTTCSRCGGEGQIVKNPCRNCNGTGLVRKRVSIDVNIPAGIENGMQLSVSGQGHAGKHGGPSGDLLVLVEELPHERFLRDGKDLFCTQIISVTDAILGTDVTIQALDGAYKVKVEPGTQSGTVVRLKGKGLPGLRNYLGSSSGDLYVKFIVWIPKKLSRSEKDALENLRTSESFTPNPSREDRSLFDKMKENF